MSYDPVSCILPGTARGRCVLSLNHTLVIPISGRGKSAEFETRCTMQPLGDVDTIDVSVVSTQTLISFKTARIAHERVPLELTDQNNEH